jgi:nucleoside-diphosphate-sugar epimerase
MKVFFAGASGVIGRRLLPRLVEDGHEVVALTRTSEKAEGLRAAGAEAVVCDVLDAEGLRDAVVAAEPEVVLQHLTDLPQDLNARNLKRAYEANDRVRGEGGSNLLAAARAAGARRYIAQNVCFLYEPTGGPVKDEEAPLFTSAPPPFDHTIRATQEMERGILAAEGIEGLVLRFGFWYGPGTTFAEDGYTAREVMRRRFPIVGGGRGINSFVHIDDVAEATIEAMERGTPGVYNVCDDDPAPMAEWLPAYAEALGAKSPRRVPRWLARLVAGPYAVYMATELRGASNGKAKRELSWRPKWPSWRQGFKEALRPSGQPTV